MPISVRRIAACRACADPRLDSVLDLGNLAISDFLSPGQEPDRAPLELVRCAGCGLVQLRHSVDRDRLYKTYHYHSSVNETMVAALKDVVDDASSRVTLEPGDAVLDIGCNDGALLRQYPVTLRRIGFDPSDVATDAWLAGGGGYDLTRDYFPPTRQHTPVLCKVITAVAMFYDLDDPGAFLEEVKRWLHPEGVLVLQFQDLASMLHANAVDNVCHEHLTYWDEAAIGQMLDTHDLYVERFTHHPINGGSLRVIARHGRLSDVNAERMLRGDLMLFTERAVRNKIATRKLLADLAHQGKTVYGIAASTKWNTLSQFYGISPDLIAAIGERSPAKVGKTTVTGIPIISEQAMRDAHPDYLFCCAWQFADTFAERERALLEQGTRLIAPLPTLRVTDAARTTALTAAG
jgi:SAM-dependent methyltransferase